MNFTKISDYTQCDCLRDSTENTTDTFVRKVRRSVNLNENDFRNHIERNKIPNDNCEEICGYHGLSFEKWNDESCNFLMQKYLTTISISPKSKNNLCVVKFLPDSGQIKYTPNQQIYNKYHYDFFKDDAFTTEALELIEMIPLNIE